MYKKTTVRVHGFVPLREDWLKSMEQLLEVYTKAKQDNRPCPFCSSAGRTLSRLFVEVPEYMTEDIIGGPGCGACVWVYFTGLSCEQYFEKWWEEEMKKEDPYPPTLTFVRRNPYACRQWAEHRVVMLKQWIKRLRSWKAKS